MSKNLYLEAGKIANTHGIGGDIIADSYCDSPEVLASLPSLFLKVGEEYTELSVKKASIFKNRVIFHFEGYNRIEDAMSLKNRIIYALREDFCLEEGENFVVDLIGLSVFDADTKECYGRVSDVLNYGASDIYELTKTDGTKAYIPVVPDFVKKIDINEGIYISVIEGLL